MTNSRALILGFAAVLSTTLVSPPPSAAFVDSIDDIPWTVFENGGEDTGQLTLVQANDPGFACQRLTGTLTNYGKVGTPVSGFYCPGSGRLVLARRDAKGVYQTWFGQITEGAECVRYVAGSVARLRGKTSTLGEVAFRLHPNCD